ncbi:MAG: hypothetical protein Q9215_007667 [Flavoplaca cf. flavocitrina]
MADLHGVPWADFRDPNFPWSDGPHPPRRSPKSNLECKRQLVWPRDKEQKGAHTWSRFADIISGKGPDMWAGKQGDDGPNRNAWTNWGYGHTADWVDNLGYRDKRDGGMQRGPNEFGLPFLKAHRSLNNEKYDFKTRKYKQPRPGDWSDVKWDRRGRDWFYCRHANGVHEYRPQAFMTQNQRERDLGLWPFVYYPFTSTWDWHHDQTPLDWPFRY